jgi:cytochrome c oxidase cbb3-type subunit 3
MNLSFKTGNELILFLVLVILVIFAVVILFVVFNILSSLKQIDAERSGKIIKVFSINTWLKDLAGAVPLEKEEMVLLNHNYDGIMELDNHLPPWWKNLFYLTIVFAVIYLLDYHVWYSSPNQETEYLNEIAAAEKKIEEYRAKNANSIDENSVKLLVSDTKVLAKGKEIFTEKCVACHGADGQGGVGPNLTDEFWIHGGTIDAIFKTIKNGVPEKGMIAWKSLLNSNEMQDVSNYIASLAGTNPLNGKAPQGDKVAVDSIATN